MLQLATSTRNVYKLKVHLDIDIGSNKTKLLTASKGPVPDGQ